MISLEKRAGVLAAFFFLTQCLFAYQPEQGFWAQRRRAARDQRGAVSASVSGSATVGSLAAQFPAAQSVTPSLSRALTKSVPAPFLNDHRDLLNSLSSGFGSIRKISLPINQTKRSPVVVHIQDVHMNSEAQWNIRETVGLLLKSQVVDLVGLEGSTEEINLQPFVDFPSRRAVRASADFVLKQKKITGPVHAAMTAEGTLPRVIGVDDPVHYPANIQAYRDAEPLLAQERNRVEEMLQRLDREKLESCSPNLIAFDSVVRSFDDQKISLGAYVLEMGTRTQTLPATVDRFTRALNLERTLDFHRVEKERVELIRTLTMRLNRQETDSLLAESTAYRAGRIGYGVFYEHLQNLCRSKSVSLGQFPAMDAYVKYVLLADGIDAEQLFKELVGLEKSIYFALALTAKEKEWLARSREVRLLKKLVNFSMTPADWKEYEPLAGKAEWAPFEAFYREAHIRDGAMADNLLKALEAGHGTTALLVTGGYHAEGIADRLTSQGVTVLSYVPKIDKVDTAQGSAYLSVFSQEKTPLEKLFAGEKLFLGHNPAGGTAETATLAVALVSTENQRMGVKNLAKLTFFLKQFCGEDVSLNVSKLEYVKEVWSAQVEITNGRYSQTYSLTANNEFKILSFQGQNNPVAPPSSWMLAWIVPLNKLLGRWAIRVSPLVESLFLRHVSEWTPNNHLWWAQFHETSSPDGLAERLVWMGAHMFRDLKKDKPLSTYEEFKLHFSWNRMGLAPWMATIWGRLFLGLMEIAAEAATLTIENFFTGGPVAVSRGVTELEKAFQLEMKRREDERTRAPRVGVLGQPEMKLVNKEDIGDKPVVGRLLLQDERKFYLVCWKRIKNRLGEYHLELLGGKLTNREKKKKKLKRGLNREVWEENRVRTLEKLDINWPNGKRKFYQFGRQESSPGSNPRVMFFGHARVSENGATMPKVTSFEHSARGMEFKSLAFILDQFRSLSAGPLLIFYMEFLREAYGIDKVKAIYPIKKPFRLKRLTDPVVIETDDWWFVYAPNINEQELKSKINVVNPSLAGIGDEVQRRDDEDSLLRDWPTPQEGEGRMVMRRLGLENPSDHNEEAGRATSLWLLKLFEMVGAWVDKFASQEIKDRHEITFEERFGIHYMRNAPRYEWGLAAMALVANLLWVNSVWMGVGFSALFVISHFKIFNLKTDVKVGPFRVLVMAVIYGALIAFSPDSVFGLIHGTGAQSVVNFFMTVVIWHVAYGIHRYFDPPWRTAPTENGPKVEIKPLSVSYWAGRYFGLEEPRARLVGGIEMLVQIPLLIGLRVVIQGTDHFGTGLNPFLGLDPILGPLFVVGLVYMFWANFVAMSIAANGEGNDPPRFGQLWGPLTLFWFLTPSNLGLAFGAFVYFVYFMMALVDETTERKRILSAPEITKKKRTIRLLPALPDGVKSDSADVLSVRILVKVLDETLWGKRVKFLFVKNQDGRWEVPGGGRNFGETIPQAALREIEEELGKEFLSELKGFSNHIPPISQFVHAIVLGNKMKYRSVSVVQTEPRYQPKVKLNHESLAHRWMTLPQAMRMYMGFTLNTRMTLLGPILESEYGVTGIVNIVPMDEEGNSGVEGSPLRITTKEKVDGKEIEKVFILRHRDQNVNAPEQKTKITLHRKKPSLFQKSDILTLSRQHMILEEIVDGSGLVTKDSNEFRGFSIFYWIARWRGVPEPFARRIGMRGLIVEIPALIGARLWAEDPLAQGGGLFAYMGYDPVGGPLLAIGLIIFAWAHYDLMRKTALIEGRFPPSINEFYKRLTLFSLYLIPWPFVLILGVLAHVVIDFYQFVVDTDTRIDRLISSMDVVEGPNYVFLAPSWHGRDSETEAMNLNVKVRDQNGKKLYFLQKTKRGWAFPSGGMEPGSDSVPLFFLKQGQGRNFKTIAVHVERTVLDGKDKVGKGEWFTLDQISNKMLFQCPLSTRLALLSETIEREYGVRDIVSIEPIANSPRWADGPALTLTTKGNKKYVFRSAGKNHWEALPHVAVQIFLKGNGIPTREIIRPAHGTITNPFVFLLGRHPMILEDVSETGTSYFSASSTAHHFFKMGEMAGNIDKLFRERGISTTDLEKQRIVSIHPDNVSFNDKGEIVSIDFYPISPGWGFRHDALIGMGKGVGDLEKLDAIVNGYESATSPLSRSEKIDVWNSFNQQTEVQNYLTGFTRGRTPGPSSTLQWFWVRWQNRVGELDDILRRAPWESAVLVLVQGVAVTGFLFGGISVVWIFAVSVLAGMLGYSHVFGTYVMRKGKLVGVHGIATPGKAILWFTWTLVFAGVLLMIGQTVPAESLKVAIGLAIAAGARLSFIVHRKENRDWVINNLPDLTSEQRLVAQNILKALEGKPLRMGVGELRERIYETAEKNAVSEAGFKIDLGDPSVAGDGVKFYLVDPVTLDKPGNINLLKNLLSKNPRLIVILAQPVDGLSGDQALVSEESFRKNGVGYDVIVSGLKDSILQAAGGRPFQIMTSPLLSLNTTNMAEDDPVRQASENAVVYVLELLMGFSAKAFKWPDVLKAFRALAEAA